MKNYRIILGTLIFLIADPSHLCIEKDLSTRSEPTWTLSTCWKAWWRCLWRSMSSGCTGGDRTGRGAWLRYLPCLCRELQRSLILSIFLSPVLKGSKITCEMIQDHDLQYPVAVQFAGTVCYYAAATYRQEYPSWLSYVDRLFGSVWIIYPLYVFCRELSRASSQSEKGKSDRIFRCSAVLL